MAGVCSRSSPHGRIDPVLWILGADVSSAPRLRNRRTLSSNRAPRRFVRLRNVLGGAPGVASGKRGHEPALLDHHMGLLWW